MSIIFLPCIFKLRIKEGQKEKTLHKRKWLHFLIMIILTFGYTIMKILVISSKISLLEKKQINTQVVNPLAEGPFLYTGIEMILLSVASTILLKYKYFIHHVIAIAGFILFGNFSDIILDYYPHIILYGVLVNITQISSILVNVIYYYYQKYMMEKLFYLYWIIGFIIGLSFFLYGTAILIYVLIEKEKTNPLIINGHYFYSYFKNEHVGLKIGKQLLIFIFSFFGGALNILNVYYFNPNYNLICYQLFAQFADVLINEIKNERFYCIIFFIFQLFFSMIYLEILELNFCNLNKNTKRNIKLRSIKESSRQNERYLSFDSGIIDINKEYSKDNLENGDKNDKNIELFLQNDDEVISSSE